MTEHRTCGEYTDQKKSEQLKLSGFFFDLKEEYSAYLVSVQITSQPIVCALRSF